MKHGLPIATTAVPGPITVSLLALLVWAQASTAAPAQVTPPNPTATLFVPVNQTAVVANKTFSSSGLLTGTQCFPIGAQFGCGAQASIPAGTQWSFTTSATPPPGNPTPWAGGTYTFNQTYTHTSGPCERCQLYVCFPNSLLQHWSASRTSGGFGWNNSVSAFFPSTAAVSVGASCVGDLSCPGCIPPASVATLSSSTPGASNSVRVLIVNLAEFFTILFGTPPAGHPILNPHSLLTQLNDWQRCEIVATLGYIQVASGITFTHLFIVDAGGSTVFDLSVGLTICPCVTIPTSPSGPGSFQLLESPCLSVSNAPYFLAVTLNQGAFPSGWFFGLDLGMPELIGLFSAGFPFTGSLDAIGASAFGPVPFLPAGLTLYAVMTHWTAGYGALISVRPAVSYTIP